MTFLLGVVGAALIAVASYDALVTTVAVGSGSRPLTAHVVPAWTWPNSVAQRDGAPRADEAAAA